MNESPAWVRRMENGYLGEARTSAVLADRFWVLTRSVDIEGADFLVQERELGPRANRLGIVQAKFLQDERTALNIHRAYVEDNNGQPYTEFWLMAHTGTAGTAQVFLLSAAEVQEVGKENLTEKSDESKYRLPGSDVLSSRFSISTHLDEALRRISRSLQAANWRRNREYITVSGFGKAASPPSPEWFSLGIPNYHTWSLEDAFNEVRRSVRKIAWEVSEKADLVDTIVNSPDPEEVLAACEQLEDMYAGSGRPPRLFDEDLLRAMRSTKKRADLLQERRLENPYRTLVVALKSRISELLAENGQTAPGFRSWRFVVDQSSLELQGAALSLTSKDEFSRKAPSEVSSQLADNPHAGCCAVGDIVWVWDTGYAGSEKSIEGIVADRALEAVLTQLESGSTAV